MIRPGAIGDFIVSLPALEALRADYTEVWCAGQNVPLARFADRAQSIVSSGLDRVGLLPAKDVLERLATFDSIVSWYGTAREEFRECVRGLPFVFLPALPQGRSHAVDFYNDQVRGLHNLCPGPRDLRVFHELRVRGSSAPSRPSILLPAALQSARR